MTDHPQRKPNRLKTFDYSAPGAYFITICTKDRRNLFWNNVGASIARPQEVILSHAGRIVDTAIRDIPVHYPAVSVDRYVIMPNHIHLLLQIHTDTNGQRIGSPTISVIVQQMKGYVSKQIGCSIWQKLFHDHVIRDIADYQKIWVYIENNPIRWQDDCFFQP